MIGGGSEGGRCKRWEGINGYNKKKTVRWSEGGGTEGGGNEGGGNEGGVVEFKNLINKYNI